MLKEPAPVPENNRRSALENHPPQRPGIREVRCGSIVQINGMAADELQQRLADWKFATPPGPLKASRGSNARLLWSGPDQYLLISESLSSAEVITALDSQFNGSGATWVDLSQARTVFELSGPHVRDILAKGCPLDLDALQPGDCAPCLLAHFNILLHCQAPDRFEILVFRSFGRACLEWLEHAAAEFEA